MPCLCLQTKNIPNFPFHFTISPHLIQLLNRDVKWLGEIGLWVSPFPLHKEENQHWTRLGRATDVLLILIRMMK